MLLPLLIATVSIAPIIGEPVATQKQTVASPLRALTIGPDGSTMIALSEKLGILRSSDGGSRWRVGGVGLNRRVLSPVAIDPYQPKRCFVLAESMRDSDRSQSEPRVNASGGIFRSEDAGATWKLVHPIASTVSSVSQDAFAFDPTGFDKKLGGSRIGYVVLKSGLFGTLDGGDSWHWVAGESEIGDLSQATLQHHPLLPGILYIASRNGIHRTRDAGRRFERVRNGQIGGVGVSPSAADAVWGCDGSSVVRSQDSGRTWRYIGSPNGSTKLSGLKLSEADPDHISVWSQDSDQKKLFISHDGGSKWFLPKLSNPKTILVNVAWHPENRDLLFAASSSGLLRSDDAGRTFRPVPILLADPSRGVASRGGASRARASRLAWEDSIQFR